MVRIRKPSVARVAAIFCAGAIASLTTSALAEDLIPAKERFDYWSTFLVEEGGAKYCYAATPPVNTSASKDNIKRGPAYLMVSTFPDRGAENEVSVHLGYPANSDKPLTLQIGAAEFRLFNDGEIAWFERSNRHNEAVTAMRRGAKAQVTATSTRGTAITDEYSLIGFTKALESMAELCK